MLPQDFILILFSTLYVPFCILFQIYFRHIDKKKKKVSYPVQYAIPAKN